MSDFRYQRLLEIKEKLLEHKQTEVEAALAAVSAVIEEIRTVEREIVETYSPLLTRCLTGSELTELTGYLAYLDTRKAALLEEKLRREEKVVALRAELLGLEMELKILEKLKSKALQAARKARNRKEQKLMDELALRTDGR